MRSELASVLAKQRIAPLKRLVAIAVERRPGGAVPVHSWILRRLDWYAVRIHDTVVALKEVGG